MKKILSIFLVVCISLSLILALVSCNTEEDPTTIPPTNDQSANTALTEEQWNQISNSENFNNVTFEMIGKFDKGGYTEDFRSKIYLDGNKVYDTYFEPDGSEVYDFYDTPEMVSAIKSVYFNTVLAIVSSFDNFTYNSTENVYTANDEITYSVQVIGYDADITASNVRVELDSNSKIAKILCDMRQETEESGAPLTINLIDVQIIFCDYGTTVVTPIEYEE